MAQWTRAWSPGRITAKETWGEMPGVPLVCVSPRLQQACQCDLGQGDRGLWPYGSYRWVARWGRGMGSSSPGVKEKVTGPEFKVGASPGSAYGSPYPKFTLTED